MFRGKRARIFLKLSVQLRQGMTPKCWELEASILEGDQYIQSDTSVKVLSNFMYW
jgi:hypothetical protein